MNPSFSEAGSRSRVHMARRRSRWVMMATSLCARLARGPGMSRDNTMDYQDIDSQPVSRVRSAGRGRRWVIRATVVQKRFAEKVLFHSMVIHWAHMAGYFNWTWAKRL